MEAKVVDWMAEQVGRVVLKAAGIMGTPVRIAAVAVEIHMDQVLSMEQTQVMATLVAVVVVVHYPMMNRASRGGMVLQV